MVRTCSGPSVKASGSRPVALRTRATSVAGSMPAPGKRAATPIGAPRYTAKGSHDSQPSSPASSALLPCS